MFAMNKPRGSEVCVGKDVSATVGAGTLVAIGPGEIVGDIAAAWRIAETGMVEVADTKTAVDGTTGVSSARGTRDLGENETIPKTPKKAKSMPIATISRN